MMKNVPKKPKTNKSLLKKTSGERRLNYTRDKAKAYVKDLMDPKGHNMSQVQAMKEAIRTFRVDEMQELELRRMFD